MSVQAIAWAISKPVTPTQKLVLLVLANYTDDQGRCWPSVQTVVANTGLSESGVHGAIRDLIALELVIRHPRPGRSNHWSLPELGGASGAPPAPKKRGPRGAPPGAGGAPPGVHVAHPEPSVEPSPNQEPGAAPRRDGVWEGLEDWLGYTPSTKSERGRWNRAAQEIRAVLGYVAAEASEDSTNMVRALTRTTGARYDRLHPEWERTPTALAGHWGELQGRVDGPPPDPWETAVAAPEVCEHGNLLGQCPACAEAARVILANARARFGGPPRVESAGQAEAAG